MRKGMLACLLPFGLLSVTLTEAGGIHKAVQRGNIDRVRQLLAADQSIINSKNEEGLTALAYAARYDRKVGRLALLSAYACLKGIARHRR